jgi:hypothetical protein
VVVVVVVLFVIVSDCECVRVSVSVSVRARERESEREQEGGVDAGKHVTKEKDTINTPANERMLGGRIDIQREREIVRERENTTLPPHEP